MKRLYALVGRVLFWMLRPVLRIIFKRTATKRVRIVVTNRSGEILLVKGWFSRQLWELPGGGINPGESPEVAAQRELYEETGLRVDPKDCQFIGEFKHPSRVTPFTVLLFRVEAAGEPKIPMSYRWEILCAQWWSKRGLPTGVEPLVTRVLSAASELE